MEVLVTQPAELVRSYLHNGAGIVISGTPGSWGLYSSRLHEKPENIIGSNYVFMEKQLPLADAILAGNGKKVTPLPWTYYKRHVAPYDCQLDGFYSEDEPVSICAPEACWRALALDIALSDASGVPFNSLPCTTRDFPDESPQQEIVDLSIHLHRPRTTNKETSVST